MGSGLWGSAWMDRSGRRSTFRHSGPEPSHCRARETRRRPVPLLGPRGARTLASGARLQDASRLHSPADPTGVGPPLNPPSLEIVITVPPLALPARAARLTQGVDETFRPPRCPERGSPDVGRRSLPRPGRDERPGPTRTGRSGRTEARERSSTDASGLDALRTPSIPALLRIRLRFARARAR